MLHCIDFAFQNSYGLSHRLRSVFILVCCLLAGIPAQAQDDDFNFKNPFDYNNYIVREFTTTVQKNFEYIAFSVHSEEYEQLEVKRKEVVDEIIQAKNRISQMPPLDDETRLRDEAVAVLTEYQRAFEQDYQRIITLKRKSRNSFEAMQAYFKAEDDAEAEVHKATRKLLKAQHDFASKNNLNVVNAKGDDDLERKMEKVTAVNNYWRAIFLDYFRVSRQYDRMWDELPGQKAVAINRERMEVLKVANEVLPALRSRADFRGDHDFRDQTINIVEYYQSVSEKNFKRIVDILGMKSMSQQDIDEINKIISQCNANHERLTYNWNISLQELLRKNVEKQ